ncbi:hypothetical protein UlMin_028894 [Ulmus minor]
MKNLILIQILFCSFFVFLVLQPAISDEVEDEREFNYEEGDERGPGRWGELKPEWNLCSHGTMQSPIDLLDKRVQVVSHLGGIHTNYNPANATLKNRGHDIMLKWKTGEAGYLEMNGTQYLLQQIHWHSPSEHTINGNKFALEAHLVHETPSGQVIVVGILYQFGQPDSFLSKMEDHLDEVSDTEEETVVGYVDPNQIRIGSRNYYRYVGSLTIPPCTQNVLEQVEWLRVAVHDDSNSNARPLQPINGRQVQLYKDEKIDEED